MTQEFDMTILITGGSGKTGSRIAKRLIALDQDVRVASRSNKALEGAQSVQFSWYDKATFAAAVEGVKSVYLLAPANDAEPLNAMKSFIDYMLAHGVKRFVLLSASSLPKGGVMMGAVHAYLEQVAPEWAVLRPTWFMQNFSEQQHLYTIKDSGCFYSATDNGKVPFIDVNDIANVAVEALIGDDILNRDLILTGPQSISYDEVANILTQVIGRQVKHVKLSEQELITRFVESGMEDIYAQALAKMDTAISKGSEDMISEEVVNMTQIAPTRFNIFAKSAVKAWL
jgi:ergot alkaloid biosynthesis protein